MNGVLHSSIPSTFEQLRDENFSELAKDYGNETISISPGLQQNNTPVSPINSLRVVELADFLAINFPLRELILAPWLPKAGLCMVHARPGIGKTFVSLNIAYAVASGDTFLNWKAEKPRGVLVIDGEMPGTTLQERLANIVLMYGQQQLPAKLQFITPDLQALGIIPDLETVEGQQQINEYIVLGSMNI
jgi:hypothetical protein